VFVSSNGTAVDVNAPLLLQFHFQPPPGAYNSASALDSASTVVHEHDPLAFNVSFLRRTMHSAPCLVRFTSFPFNHPNTAVESSTTTISGFACQPYHQPPFPTTTTPGLLSLRFALLTGLRKLPRRNLRVAEPRCCCSSLLQLDFGLHWRYEGTGEFGGQRESCGSRGAGHRGDRSCS